MLLLAVVSEVLLPTFWLEHKQVRAHTTQGRHVGAVTEARPDARPVVGQPVVRPELLGILFQSIKSTEYVFTCVVLVAHDIALAHNRRTLIVREEHGLVMVGPTSER